MDVFHVYCFRAGNLFQSPLVPQDECHKKFTCPYVILLVLNQIATEYFLNQKSDQIHVDSFTVHLIL